jgi:YVTN family beta-propeller protein
MCLAAGVLVPGSAAGATAPGAAAALPVGTSPVLAADYSAGTVMDIGHGWKVPLNVGVGPTGVAFTPDGTYAYATNTAGSVSVISGADTATPKVAATLNLGGASGADPTAVAVTPNGQYAYVANISNSAQPGTVSVIDGADTGHPTVSATQLTVGGGPSAVAVTPNGQYAYVTNETDGSVSVISGADTASPQVTDTLQLSGAPKGVAVTPNGQYAYVTGTGTTGAGVTVLSGVESPIPKVETTLTVGGGPIGVTVTPNGQYAYVARYSASSVSVIGGAETTTPHVTDTTLNVGTTQESVAITPDGQYAYVAHFGFGEGISVISGAGTATPKVAATLQTDGELVAVAVDPQIVGTYANFPTAASVGAALDDNWPLVANPSATSKPAHCQAPYTGAGSDKVMAQGLGSYELDNSEPVPWLSFWTVDAPPKTPKEVPPEQEGLAAGKHAASEIAAAALASPGFPVTPTYVVLDPEGQACGNGTPGESIGNMWHGLPLKTWQALVAGWDAGIQTVAGLTPAVYLDKWEYNNRGGAVFISGSGYSHVFVAVQFPAHARPKISGTGANVVGYSAYYAPVTAKGVCGDAAADISNVISWGGSLNTVQFGYPVPGSKPPATKYASKLCPP